MKKYNFITLAMGLTVSLFLFLTGVLEIGWFIIVSMIPAANYALSVFCRRIKGIPKTLMSGLFIIISILINLSFLSALTVSLLNLPPQKAFEAEIKTDPYDQEGDKAFNELQTLFSEFNKKKGGVSSILVDKYLSSDIAIDSSILSAISGTRDIRKRIIDITSKNTLYINNSYHSNDGKVVNPQSNNGFMALFRTELSEIKYMFTQGQHESSMTKYRLLWDSSVNLLDCKNPTFINSLIGRASLNLLMDFYNNNKKFFPENYLKDINFNKDELIKKLENCWENGLNNEYLSTASRIRSLKYKWPLLDYNKTANEIYDTFAKLIKESKLDLNPENSTSKSNQAYTLSLKNFSLFNPIGTFYIEENTLLFGNINNGFYKTKNMIKALVDKP